MSVDLTNPIFHDNNAARAHLEAIRWPDGPVCAHCNSEHVKKLSEDYGLTNVTLTPTEEYVWDPLYKWTPIDYSRDEIAVPDEDEDCTPMN